MKTVRHFLMTSFFVVLLKSVCPVQGAGPLPVFTFQGAALHPDHLAWAPTGELELPTVIKMEGRVEKPLGRYYRIYCASLLQWDSRNFIVYQDGTGWRGGNIKYVEVDGELNPVGNKGERFVLVDPPPEPPLKDRYRSAEFYFEGDTLYMISGAGSNPRMYVYATASVASETGNKVD